MLKQLLIVLLSVWAICVTATSPEMISEIVDKRSGDSIQSYCAKKASDRCEQLDIFLVDSESGEKTLLKRFDANKGNSVSPSEGFFKLESLKKIELMKSGRYEVFKAVNLVCQFGDEQYRTKWFCLTHAGVAYAVLGTLAALGAPAAILIKVFGMITVTNAAAWKDIPAASRPVLLPLAFVSDVVRAVTALPVKKINLLIQKNRYNKKVFPLFEELLDDSYYNDFGSIVVRHRMFDDLVELLQESS